MINAFLADQRITEYMNELNGMLVNPSIPSDKVLRDIEKAKKENDELVHELRAHFDIDSTEFAIEHSLPF